MPTIRDNDFHFKMGRGISSVYFEYGNEYIVSEGQPFVGVLSYEGDITVRAGRHGSSMCADWYNESVSSNPVNMVHTLGGSKIPKDLNFAIKGKLTVNGNPFDICLGQGHNDEGNNWHLASSSITADADNKNGEIGNGIRLTQDESHTFVLTTSIP